MPDPTAELAAEMYRHALRLFELASELDNAPRLSTREAELLDAPTTFMEKAVGYVHEALYRGEHGKVFNDTAPEVCAMIDARDRLAAHIARVGLQRDPGEAHWVLRYSDDRPEVTLPERPTLKELEAARAAGAELEVGRMEDGQYVRLEYRHALEQKVERVRDRELEEEGLALG